jgi:hypothetical protein
MLVPRLDDARERRRIEVPEVDTPHLRPESCAGRDRLDCARRRTARGYRFTAQCHRFLPHSATGGVSEA